MNNGKHYADTAHQYEKYRLLPGQVIVCVLKGIAIDIVISFLFFRSFLAVIVFLFFLPVYMRITRKELRNRRLEELKLQFKEGIQAILFALEAGYSLENSFEEAVTQLRLLYPENADIIWEFNQISQGVRMNRPIEELLVDFSQRCQIEEITNFTEVFVIAKRRGGNMLEMIRHTVRIIRERLEVQQEIHTLMAGKWLEQRIMNVVPLGILFYVNITSGDFLSCMYHNTGGVVIMSVCLAGYTAAVFLSKHIVTRAEKL